MHQTPTLPKTPPIGVSATLVQGDTDVIEREPEEVESAEEASGVESFHFLEEHSDVTYQGGFTTILAEDSEENSIRRRVRQGEGTYRDKGTSLTCTWEEDQPAGPVHIDYPSGAKYVGESDGVLYHGQGRYTWADGSWYEGEWYKNKIHGKGKYCNKDGQMFEGIYYSNTGPGLP
mmetsp:Transcript_24578/g.46590  ORF Transcript_24578/g.46590 Transcript_24578/m.46590 type:complete len:175 (+) Transcript_24578:159-683(+)